MKLQFKYLKFANIRKNKILKYDKFKLHLMAIRKNFSQVE